jgi:hypothetical protein
MWEYVKYALIPVDSEGSCRDQHILVSGPWHRYNDEQGRLIAVRCPHMLSHDERSRVMDNSYGDALERLESKRHEKLMEMAQRRLAEKKEKRENSWRA